MVENDELSDIALSFCRECLGWKNANHVNDWGYRYIRESVTREEADTPCPPYERFFLYLQLEKVIEKAAAWCEKNGHPFPTGAAEDGSGAERQIAVYDDFYLCNLDTDDPHRMILAACLKAHRARTGDHQNV